MKNTDILIGEEEFQLLLTSTIDDVVDLWDTTARKSIYYESDYLRILEKHGPLGFRYYYTIVLRKGQPLAIFYFQHKTIELYHDFRLHTHSHNPLVKLFYWLQRQSFRLIRQELLISGNVLLTGEYAFYFKQNLPAELKEDLCHKIYREVANYIKEVSDRKIQSILSKDFYLSQELKIDDFPAGNFTRFAVQPDMILRLDPSWESFEDYLAAVRSKYRVKFKKVMRKGKALEFREFNNQDLQRWGADMYHLYLHTAEKANFSLFTLDKDYFIELKRTFGDRFLATGVFIEDTLVAFFTLILNNGNADAHFLGYDPALNIRHQVYFNILLQLVDKAISHKAGLLNLSRTALEIKSSIGAEPYDMNIYLKHNNTLLDKALPGVLDFLVPEKDWVQRSPFKD